MFISYFDESGDDGFPKYSSELFVLASVYLHYSNWQKTFAQIHEFRLHLRDKYKFPVKTEFHTKEFLLDKDPYHGKFEPKIRLAILREYCQMVSTLDLKTVAVVIDKLNIGRPNYHVLKNALTYNVQRIENDLNFLGNAAKFMIISDEGRVAAMRDVTRKIQRINYIPSMFSGASYRKEIKCLLEDPLPKNSQQSYFIQIADMVAYIVHLYARRHLCKTPLAWPNRLFKVMEYGHEVELMDVLRPVLNKKASSKNKYGVVYYPRTR
ncbi:MAG: DUF3800 domain-containing protein [Saprospiraceae bacterium]